MDEQDVLTGLRQHLAALGAAIAAAQRTLPPSARSVADLDDFMLDLLAAVEGKLHALTTALSAVWVASCRCRFNRGADGRLTVDSRECRLHSEEGSRCQP